jgi:hypothetical protein
MAADLAQHALLRLLVVHDVSLATCTAVSEAYSRVGTQLHAVLALGPFEANRFREGQAQHTHGVILDPPHPDSLLGKAIVPHGSSRASDQQLLHGEWARRVLREGDTSAALAALETLVCRALYLPTPGDGGWAESRNGAGQAALTPNSVHVGQRCLRLVPAGPGAAKALDLVGVLLEDRDTSVTIAASPAVPSPPPTSVRSAVSQSAFGLAAAGGRMAGSPRQPQPPLVEAFESMLEARPATVQPGSVLAMAYVAQGPTLEPLTPAEVERYRRLDAAALFVRSDGPAGAALHVLNRSRSATFPAEATVFPIPSLVENGQIMFVTLAMDRDDGRWVVEDVAAEAP